MARQKLGFWYRFAVGALKPPVILLTRRGWRNQELPRPGGVVVAPNHNSHFDPLAVAHYLYDNGRAPRFLAKDDCSTSRSSGISSRRRQIPVHRETGAASRDAGRRRGGRAGRVRRLLPRGHPHPRPRAVAHARQDRRGADRARDRVPGRPHGALGAHRVLAPYGKRPHLLPRRRCP